MAVTAWHVAREDASLVHVQARKHAAQAVAPPSPPPCCSAHPPNMCLTCLLPRPPPKHGNLAHTRNAARAAQGAAGPGHLPELRRAGGRVRGAGRAAGGWWLGRSKHGAGLAMLLVMRGGRGGNVGLPNQPNGLMCIRARPLAVCTCMHIRAHISPSVQEGGLTRLTAHHAGTAQLACHLPPTANRLPPRHVATLAAATIATWTFWLTATSTCTAQQRSCGSSTGWGWARALWAWKGRRAAGRAAECGADPPVAARGWLPGGRAGGRAATMGIM